MRYYAGIDVSLEQSSVCIVDDQGEIVREVKVLSEPDALVRFFSELDLPLTRIGLEAGLPAVLLETRHVKAVQEVRALLAGRKLLQTKLLAIEFSIRGLLRGFGLKMDDVSKSRFAARVEELIAGHAMLEQITSCRRPVGRPRTGSQSLAATIVASELDNKGPITEALFIRRADGFPGSHGPDLHIDRQC